MADLVWFLHGRRDDPERLFIQAKMRNGRLGRWKMDFIKEMSRFEEQEGRSNAKA